jgi:hypothetical protein
MPSVNNDQGSTQKEESARISWSIRHVIFLIVDLCALIAIFLAVLRQSMETSTMVFLIATLAATRVIRFVEFIRTGDRIRWPWGLSVTYGLILSLGSNWMCAFLWFSRRYALFSVPVVGAMVLIIASYGAVALFIALLALLTEGNWRRSLLAFSYAPALVAIVILRLRLLE